MTTPDQTGGQDAAAAYGAAGPAPDAAVPAGRVGREPTAAELAAIEREWPLIAAEMAVLDAEIDVLAAPGQVPELAWRRLARAREQVLQTRVLSTTPRRPRRSA